MRLQEVCQKKKIKKNSVVMFDVEFDDAVYVIVVDVFRRLSDEAVKGLVADGSCVRTTRRLIVNVQQPP